MNELFAAFAAEIFRPIITLLIPGIWAITPGLITIFLRFHEAWQFVLAYRTPSALVFLTIATAVGMILENFSGELENFYFDKHGQKALDEWYQYLRLPRDPDLIAFSYISSYVLRMKFEGGMAAGSLFALIGTVLLPVPPFQKTLYVVLELALLIYLGHQVKQSTQELVNVRRRITQNSPQDS
jgi:hypothetical protein